MLGSDKTGKMRRDHRRALAVPARGRGGVAWAARLAEPAPEDPGTSAVAMSGGMRRRVAIARAPVQVHGFIHFDEPVTALDVAMKRRTQVLVIAVAQAARFAVPFMTRAAQLGALWPPWREWLAALAFCLARILWQRAFRPSVRPGWARPGARR
jgi:hypothetical protein